MINFTTEVKASNRLTLHVNHQFVFEFVWLSSSQ